MLITVMLSGTYSSADQRKTEGRAEINNALYSGRKMERNLKNPLSFPRPRDSGEEGI